MISNLRVETLYTTGGTRGTVKRNSGFFHHDRESHNLLDVSDLRSLSTCEAPCSVTGELARFPLRSCVDADTISERT